MDNHIFLSLENVVGENTSEKYEGTFKVLKYLTNRQRAETARYLELLCRDIERDNATMILMQAIAYLKTHVVEAPRWWTESENGLNLVDNEPIFNLYSQLLKAQNPKKFEEKAPETPATSA